MTSEYLAPTILSSRRLFGPNLFSREPGAVLDVVCDSEAGHRAVAAWSSEALRLAVALGWADTTCSAHPFRDSASLFLAAAHSLNDRFEREHDASRHDALTGLRNRRSFLEAWEEALQRSRRSGKPMSLVLGDLDHFKRINDTHGHACGDAVLRAVAQAIRNSVRAQDVVSRWGGEEFMLLLPDTDLVGARHVAESTRLAIKALRVEHGGSPFEVTLSLGVCEHRPERSMEETIAEADAALYQAKQEGRDRVVAR